MKVNGKKYTSIWIEENNKVFIKYSYWNKSFRSQQFRNAINDKQEIKIFHSFPNFWKCYKSFSKL